MVVKQSSKQAKLLAKYKASIVARHKLRKWYTTPLGNATAREEDRILTKILPELFGYHLVQLSAHRNSDYLDSSLIRHKLILDHDDTHSQCRINLHANVQNIPISSDSVDVVVLPHTLDIDMSPHQVLRETDRILVPEGRVIIVGFNPWSSWGLRHLMNLWKGASPYSLRFISPTRVKDWITLLGFEIESVNTFYFRPPISNEFFINKCQFFDKLGEKAWPAFGGIYILVARKQVTKLTPIKPRWFLRRRTSVTPGFLETRNGK